MTFCTYEPITDVDRKFITVDKDECGHDKDHILQVETQQNCIAIYCSYNICITFMMVFNLHLDKQTCTLSTVHVLFSMPKSLPASFPCKLNMFRKRGKTVITSKGIQVGTECK